MEKIVPLSELIEYMIASRFRTEKGDKGELFGQVYVTGAQMKLLKEKPRSAFCSFTVEEFLRALLGAKLDNLSEEFNKTFKNLLEEFAHALVRFFHFVRVEECVTAAKIAEAFIAGQGIHGKHNQVGSDLFLGVQLPSGEIVAILIQVNFRQSGVSGSAIAKWKESVLESEPAKSMSKHIDILIELVPRDKLSDRGDLVIEKKLFTGGHVTFAI